VLRRSNDAPHHTEREFVVNRGNQEVRGASESRNERISGTTLSMEWSMNRCPPPGTMNSRLLGISREMIRALTGGSDDGAAH